jgi:ABC-2 type transport system permease protein
LTPLLLAALVAVPLLLSFVKSSEVKTIAVSDNSGIYINRLKSNDQYHFLSIGKDLKKYRQKDKESYALLVIDGDLSSKSGRVALYSQKQIEMDLKNFVKNQLETLAKEDKIASYNIPGLKQIIKDSNTKISLNTIKWDDNGKEKEGSSELAMAIGFCCTMIIYIFIFAYGAMVMNGVIEEKSNRIVEVIVSSVRPFELMMGKIVGIALVGLTQVLLWAIIIATFLGIGGVVQSVSPDKTNVRTEISKTQGIKEINSTTIIGNRMQVVNIQNTVNPNDNSKSAIAKYYQLFSNINLTEILIWFILYFLGGYLLYASLFAAVGSAIDSHEDAAQFTLPLTIPVLFALYAGMYSASNPDGPLAFWSSMIPFTSPIVMMVRLPFGVPFWQLLVSFGLLVMTFLLSTKIASKIYRTGILMYGKKVSYKELWKWLKYKN